MDCKGVWIEFELSVESSVHEFLSGQCGSLFHQSR